MAGDREVKFTEADIKSFTKEHANAKNAKMKKETSCELKLVKEFLQSKPMERYTRYSSLHCRS